MIIRDEYMLDGRDTDRLARHRYGADNYNVVEVVYRNLRMLHDIATNLEELGRAQDSIGVVRELLGSNKELKEIGNNLGKLKKIYEELDRLEDIYPDLNQLNGNVEDYLKLFKGINERLDKVESTYNDFIKGYNDKVLEGYNRIETLGTKLLGEIKDSFSQGKHELQKLQGEIKKDLNSITTMYKSIRAYGGNIASFEGRMAHLEATDAVHKALSTGKEIDYSTALKIIKLSERYENCENTNRNNLRYKLQSNKFPFVNSDRGECD